MVGERWEGVGPSPPSPGGASVYGLCQREGYPQPTPLRGPIDRSAASVEAKLAWNKGWG